VLKGFKDFILRGNVVDLAVAVVIGAAFAGVILAFTDNIIQPIITAFGGGNDPGLGFQITDNPATFVDIGAVITAIINFLIVGAAVYFFVVVPVNALLERRKRGEEPEVAATTEDIVLLQEIRDLLRQRAL